MPCDERDEIAKYEDRQKEMQWHINDAESHAVELKREVEILKNEKEQLESEVVQYKAVIDSKNFDIQGLKGQIEAFKYCIDNRR